MQIDLRMEIGFPFMPISFPAFCAIIQVKIDGHPMRNPCLLVIGFLSSCRLPEEMIRIMDLFRLFTIQHTLVLRN